MILASVCPSVRTNDTDLGVTDSCITMSKVREVARTKLHKISLNLDTLLVHTGS